MKKHAVIIGLVVLGVFALSTNAMAYVDMPSATIHRIGIHNGKTLVQAAATPTGPAKTYYLRPAYKKEQLVLLLTALAMGKTVYLRVAGSAPGSLVLTVHINNR